MAFAPAYLETYAAGRLSEKVERAREELQGCRACPRNCGVDRLAGRTAACYTGRWAAVSSFFAHFGEEDCLRGTRGSGTIFFSRCNLRCVFCQNWDISQDKTAGREVRPAQLAAMMVRLQEEGCHNINLVTPEHVAPQIVEALPHAIEQGLRLPLVYNTSGYDGPASLGLMDGLVDIYMPDFKFWAPGSCARYLRARDYPQVARVAIAEMHRQVGLLRFGPTGLAERGVLLRHLVMPGYLDETRAILHWIATELSPATYVNLMDQYRPAFHALRFPELSRWLYPEEVEAAREIARREGLSRLDERGPPPFFARG
ncbi:MAG: radical SAM protein [Candidatus Lambdaproteobacteria bacterium]|nr:radical SAM protein [Candidatus Lambdaproteobacteria bacterium]